MRRNAIALAAFVLIFAASSFAQDAMPTKEETVNYLNKRLQEVEGRTEKVSNDLTRRFTNLSFTMKGDEAVYVYSRIGGLDGVRTARFNPGHLDYISVLKPVEGETIGWVHVTFKGKFVKQTCKRDCDETTSYFSFPYLATSPESGKKIEKAFLHLRDLVKAEEDIF